MRLASLTLQGFKSFADRTTLEFTEPVTAIVGPNGSGKSNLIDALRWASGGGRASEFRAGDKRELIFHGSAGKRSLGFAEVQLEFEHQGRTLSVSRTLARDGESRLKVGGRTARFVDLEEELSGSGLGRGGLAVIGQGEVSEVLMADPPKLLAYLAESVGVAKLSSRREGTLAGLGGAQAHLTRLEDVRVGLEERVAALGREAREAEQAAALERERLLLRFSLSWRRVEGLEGELGGLRERGALLEARLLEGREALSDAQERRREAKAALGEAEAHYREFVAAREARRGDLRVAQEGQRAAAAREAALAREAARIEADVQALAALTPPVPPEGSEAEAVAALAAAEAQSGEFQARLDEVRREVGRRSDELEAAQRAEAEAAQARSRFEASREGLREGLREAEAQLAAQPSTDLSALQHAAAEAEGTRQEVETRLTGAQEALAEAQRAHAEAFAEAQARTQAAARQRAAFEARRGYAQGPKSALTSGIAGIIGSVADLITVPPEYAQAISSALSRRAEHVVVTSSEVAQEVLAHVRQAGGWVTLLPLDLIQGRAQPLAPALAAERGVLGLASEVVASEARFRPLVQQLLGGTALVSALPEAVALAKRHRHRPRLVTLQGDVLEAYGAISGGRSQSAGLVLGAAAELRSAEEAAAAARARAEALTDTLKAQQAELKGLREAHAELLARARDTSRALASGRERAAAGASLAAELNRRQAQLTAALTALTPPPEGELPDPEPLRRELQRARSEEEALRAALGAAQRAAAAADGALALSRERQAGFRAAQERFAQAQAQLEALQGRAAELARERAAAAAAAEAAQAALGAAEAALPAEDDAAAARYHAAQRLEADAEAQLEALTRQQAALGGELEALNLTRARREAALEGAADEHRAFPAGLEPLPESLAGSLKGLRDRLAEVDAELARLGPVNHRAAHEFAAQQGRLDDLTRQLADAEAAAAELRAVLGDLDDAVRERLVAGAETLARGFSLYAERLFGAGAQASVELHWEEGRPSGLKLALQPPTKQTRALSLLSVGERTMGALAFLFALMASGETSGLPLAILDEVDAPLDEANIRRFCAFLDELSARGTQFVLITHQKATMEVASALWGVTTEGGVSRVFSIRREAAA